MEKFFFKKIEVWVVLLLAVLALIGTIFFGTIVRNAAMGFDKFGVMGRFALTLASVPAEARNVFATKKPSGMVVSQNGRFEGRQGWTFQRSESTDTPNGYLLFSRYDGDKEHHIIELLDLSSGEVEHRIDLNAERLLEGAAQDSLLTDFSTWNSRRFRAIHPIALDNGDLIIKDHNAPLFRIDACGETVWRQENDLYHHTTEPGADGTFWLTTHIEPSQIEGLDPGFRDNGIVQINADGEVLYERSFTDVLLKHDLGNILFSNGRLDPDPIHLNDVQPVLKDGQFWKAGDLFLSLRHLSTVVLFRPSTDEIIWRKQGPWAAQHDVDIIDNHTISVFNNNMFNLGASEQVWGNNEIVFYDFHTESVRRPYQKIFEEHDIRTESEGLFTLLPSGHLLVEEADAGRFLIFARDGTLVAENVNRASDGQTYHQGWSRYIKRRRGDAIRHAMQSKDCTAFN